MSVINLEIGLSVAFVVFLIVLVVELLFIYRSRLSFRLHSSPPPPPLPPIHSGRETHDFFTTDALTKELIYFFSLKPQTRVELDTSNVPNKNTNGSSQEEEVIDVFKLLEANEPSRFLPKVNEEDKEDVEATYEVDFTKKLTEERVDAVEEEVCVMVDGDDRNTKTLFSTPCDSPLFFTPATSPSRDFTVIELLVSVTETRNNDDR